MYWSISGSFESQIGVARFLDGVVSCDIMTYTAGGG